MSGKAHVFDKKLKVVNIGVRTFAEDLEKQGVEVVHVDWSPPAGGDIEIAKLLEKLEEGR